MRKIEKMMLKAISEKKSLSIGNTRVYASAYDGDVTVYLHENRIMEIYPNGKRVFTLAGWNTPTTRSRLRAMGIDVCQKDYAPYYKGKPISCREFYEF